MPYMLFVMKEISMDLFKELNENKKNINSNKIINFSFNKQKTEELNDNLYSPL